MGCSATEKTDFLEERNNKLDSLKEECDFVTVEYSFPDDIYICHKAPSRIKSNKSEGEAEESNESSSETE